MNSKKILRVLVIPSWYPTGCAPLTGSFFREQTAALNERCEARVLVPVGQSTRHYLAKKQLPLEVWPLSPPPAMVARYRTDRFMGRARTNRSIIDGMMRCLKEAKKEGWTPQVILAHSTAWAGVHGANLSKACGLPIVIVEHSNPWLLHQYTVQQTIEILDALKTATTLCTVCPALRRLMLMHDLPNGIHWEIVGNMVDTNLWPSSLKARTREKPFTILTVAARSSYKDTRTLIQSAAILRSKDPTVTFKIKLVGDGIGTGPSFTEHSHEAGISDIVEIIPTISREVLPSLMGGADLFISSSISETFGIVMAEALACGIPVIATRSGGAEYILGEASPFLVEVQDAKAMAEKIGDFMAGRLAFDATAARADIEARFGKQAFVSRMINILIEAVERGKKQTAIQGDRIP